MISVAHESVEGAQLSASEKRYAFGAYLVDVDAREISCDGQRVHVEPQVFDVLVMLLRQRHRVVAKEELLDEVWGTRMVSESALTTRVKALRKALGDSGQAQTVVRTAHGYGFRFVADVTTQRAASAPPRGTHLDRAGERPAPRDGRPGASGAAGSAGDRLVERDTELDGLETALAEAESGAGSVILLSGEAGSGKSSVLRAFQARVGSRARVLIGACDDLLTPRVLGPLLEVGRDPNGPLAAALASGRRDEVMTGVLAELDDPQATTVLIIEDAHWADDATIDVLRFISRRIDRMPAMLIISYRDNDLGPSHPLRRLLGRLDARRVRRIRLRSLSVDAVAALGGLGADAAADLHAVTGGNPFFVTEVLAAPGEAVPPTVVDAVMARLHDLEPAARRAVDQLSVMPAKVELPLARDVLGSLTAALTPAERAGIVTVDGPHLTFRHELARRAVESSLTSSERMTLNARVVSVLLQAAAAGPAADPAPCGRRPATMSQSPGSPSMRQPPRPRRVPIAR